MQQIIQPINGNALEVAELPAPVCGPGQVLIANHFSVISAGTERSTVSLARTSLAQKARRRPDHVRRVIEKVRAEGLGATIRQVRAKLDQPIPLGYSSAGVVIQVGEEVRDLNIGDRVASNGSHAGAVAVDQNLVARVPDAVPLDHACYAVIGSIALQGVRLGRVGIGDVVAVIGLGLIGQMTVALLKAAGCTVIGTDLDKAKQELALRMGADAAAGTSEFSSVLDPFCGGRGADAVLITASTSSNEPVELAAKVARQKGRVVAVGAVGMEIPRRDFYPKELEFVVSCSYGPGRYDPQYEEAGRDYPYAYVRWTEQRNIAAVLGQMASGALPVEKLTTHRFPIEEAASAYQMIEDAASPVLGVVLEYPQKMQSTRRVYLPDPRSQPTPTATPRLSIIGTGSFSCATLAPAFIRSKAFSMRGIVSAKGVTARTLGIKNDFDFVATDVDEVVNDPETDAVAIATRHHQHAPMALRAAKAGKHVFLEKPLAIDEEQLSEWTDYFEETDGGPIVTVGFNRRFSPAVELIDNALGAGPKMITIRFNAGNIPSDHWIHDPEIGGGRIIGEACHAVDLAVRLANSRPVRVSAESMRTGEVQTEDNVVLTLRFEDGGVATIFYCSVGNRSSGKERVEVYGQGASAVIDDFREVTIHPSSGKRLRKRWWSQQKGYAEEVARFHQAIQLGAPPIPYQQLLDGAAATLRAVQSLRLETPLDV